MNQNIVGDGICDDSANNEACAYDGGDCCSPPDLIKSLCIECVCHDGNKSPSWTDSVTTTETITSCFAEVIIGDGICDDTLNNDLCFFDGGDCCLQNAITIYCTICFCNASNFQSDTSTTHQQISEDSTATRIDSWIMTITQTAMWSTTTKLEHEEELHSTSISIDSTYSANTKSK